MTRRSNRRTRIGEQFAPRPNKHELGKQKRTSCIRVSIALEACDKILANVMAGSLSEEEAAAIIIANSAIEKAVIKLIINDIFTRTESSPS
jgi:precorrin-4 methylase